MKNRSKTCTATLSLICAIGFLSAYPAIAQTICYRGTQVSEVFTGSASLPASKTFQFDVNNEHVGRVDFFIHLSDTTFTPTFSVAVDHNSNDFFTATPVPMDAMQSLANFPVVLGFPDDVARIRSLGGNRYRLSVNFDSYYSFGLCGKRPSLPPDFFRRKIQVTIGHLTANGHLQVNAVSKDCKPTQNGGQEEAVVEISPARSYTAENALPCPSPKPTDVVVVLDHSGSMLDLAAPPNPPSDPPPSKAKVLKDSMSSFFELWKKPGQFNPSDRAGLVSIRTSATTFNAGGGVFLIPFLTDPDRNADLGDLIDEASTQEAPNGSVMTAMGPALQMALTRCSNPLSNNCTPHGGFDDTSDHYRHIVLFTDGMQNVPPNVDVPPAVTGSLTLNGFQLCSYGIPIHTIGAGIAPGTEHDRLLKRIAFDTGGRNTFTNKPLEDMEIGFLLSLIEIFKGNTLGLVAARTGTIVRGSGPVEHRFQVNRSAKRIVAMVTWHTANPADQNPSALELEVIPPGATAPTSEGIATAKNNLQSRNLMIPLSSGPAAHVGEWTIRIKERLNRPSVNYHAYLFIDETMLEYSLGVLPADYGTGTPIRLQAMVTEDGKPVTNLSEVTAQVTRPRTPLGNFLRAQQLSTSDLQNNPPGVSPEGFNNNFDRKLYRLMSNPVFSPLLEPVRESTPVTLFDDGQKIHGDEKAGDGIYSALYTNTRIPGQYVFDMTVAGNTQLMGDFARTEKSEALVRVNDPDVKNSEVSVDRTGTGGEYLITVVPADRFENFLGPGFSGAVEIAVAPGSGGLALPITDEREDGTYRVKLTDVPPNADPEITIKVAGKIIQQARLSRLSRPTKRFAVFASLGGNVPNGNFGNFFDSGFSAQLGLEYRFLNRFAVEGSFGYDRSGLSTSSILDLERFRGSGNLKFYPVTGTFQLGIFGGGGVYKFDPGDTRGGVNIGVGAEYRVTTSISVEAIYNFHNVFTPVSNVRYSNLQGGLRFRFGSGRN
jgi:hypothetical protein